jgi:hypothetical protein
MNHMRTALLAGAFVVASVAQAWPDFEFPPPLPDSSPSSSSSPDSSNHGGNRWKVTAKSLIQGQIISVGCAAVVLIADSIVTARGKDPRELTPVGAIDNAAACGLWPAMILKGINMAMGIKDNACSYDVARRALRENNSAQAKQELLWRDGSWERRQAKFQGEYHDCYRGKQPAVKKPVLKKKKKIKKIKVYRGRKLTS